MIILIVGISGSGKTEIGKALTSFLRDRNETVVHLDGDHFRELLEADRAESDYSTEGRKLNAHRIRNFALFLEESGISVIVSSQIIFPEVLATFRAEAKDYFEVFTSADEDTLRSLDYKGLNKSWDLKPSIPLVGRNIDFPKPKFFDLEIRNDFVTPPATYARRILEEVRRVR